MLEQPIGTPIDLTLEEAQRIVLHMAGRRPDLPDGQEWVRDVRENIGYSLIERLGRKES